MSPPKTFADWLSRAVDAWLADVPSRRQGDFADAIGVDPATVTRLRKDQQRPTPAQLSAIVRALKCGPDDARRAYTLGGVDVTPLLSEPAADAPEAA